MDAQVVAAPYAVPDTTPEAPAPSADEKRSTFVPGRVGVVGLGLIGGSFVKAYHAAGIEVYATNRTRETLELAIIDGVCKALTLETLPTCELLILTTYPEHTVAWLKERAALISPDAIVVDACGVKRSITGACQDIAEPYSWHFVGGHPMAGTQYSGYAHAKADLFQDAPMVLCSNPKLPSIQALTLLDRTAALLSPAGFGRFTYATPAEHDQIIAYTSQLAHVVSNAYVKSPEALRQHGFSAGSWRDLTRVAHLNAPMWTELFLQNRDYLSQELGSLITELTRYQEALESGDATTLMQLLQEGSDLKEKADRP